MFAYLSGDCSSATKTAAKLIELRSLPSFDAEVAMGYDILLACEAKNGKLEEWARLAREATQLPSASNATWAYRFHADVRQKRDGDAVDTLEIMVGAHPDALNALPSRMIWTLHFGLEKRNEPALDIRLLRIMSNPAYDPVDAPQMLDDTQGDAKVMLAGKLVAQQGGEEATKLVGEASSVSSLTLALIDPALRRLLPPTFNLRAATEAELSRHRGLMERYPNLIQPITTVGTDLLRLGRPDEAVAILETARSRITGPNAFADLDVHLSWWWDELAQAYATQGQYGKMVASFSGATKNPALSKLNVSQVINLGGNQVAFGKYDEALSTVPQPSAELASPYGVMQMHKVRGCAYALSGRLTQARAELAKARVNEADDPSTITDLMLCLGENDGAAASLASRLKDPVARRLALLHFAEYNKPDPRTPISPLKIRRIALTQRPDVQQAFAAAGGRLVVPVPEGTISI
jgi:tetratricopeptide (TPR) repeat protein